MNKTVVVSTCAGGCSFYLGAEKRMSCGHPFWDDKPKGANAIIAGIHQQAGSFPPECPLRSAALTMTFTLKAAA